MARTRKPSGRPAARRSGPAREAWFDRSRSLVELHGWPRSDPGDGLGLIGRYKAAVNRPVGQLDADQLVLLLTQKTDPRYILPIAVERARDSSASELLRHLIAVDVTFWSEHPKSHAAFVALAEELSTSLPTGMDGLAEALAAYVARVRGR